MVLLNFCISQRLAALFRRVLRAHAVTPVVSYPSAALCIVLIDSTPTYAETRVEATTLPDVVISAERYEDTYRTGDVDTHAAAAFLTVVKRDRFDGTADTLAQVLEKETGVQIRRSGGLGGFATVSLRGASADQVMVYIDGILLNEGAGGGVNLSNIALNDVDQIEIYRGVTPGNFAKGSIGGAVNIRTLRARGGYQASAGASTGSFGTVGVNGFINHKPGVWDYVIAADALQSANDYTIVNDNGTQYNSADDVTEPRSNNRLEQKTSLIKTGLDIGETIRLDLAHQWFDKNQGLPSWNNNPAAATRLFAQRQTLDLRATADGAIARNLNTSGHLYSMIQQETFDDRNGDVGLNKQFLAYDTRTIGGEFYIDYDHAHHQPGVTGGLRQETYQPTDLLGKTVPRGAQRDTAFLNLQDTWFLFDDRLTVVAGLRRQWIGDAQHADSATPNATTDTSNTYDNIAIGGKYCRFDTMCVKGNIADYAREPSFFELYGDRGYFIGNDQLTAERGISIDVGLETQWHISHLHKISWTVAYFHNTTRDVISKIFDARGVGRSVNLSRADIDGIETEFSAEWHRQLRLIFNATWQNAVQRNDIAAFNGKRLPGRYLVSSFGRLEHRLAALVIYAEHVFENGTYYDTANLLRAAAKNQFNIGATLALHRWRINVAADNITNDKHEDFNRFPMPGPAFFVAAKYDF